MKEAVLKRANVIKEFNEFALKGEIVIFGSTYMANFPFYELINKSRLENAVYNRSIEGMTVAEADELLETCVFTLKPKKLFLSLGEADIGNEKAIAQYEALVRKVRTHLPFSRVYLIRLEGNGVWQKQFNQVLSSLCDDKHVIEIGFPARKTEKETEYKSRFKLLSSFFRNGGLTMSDAFAIADL